MQAGLALGGRHLPLRRRGLDQHRARRGPGLAEGIEEVADRLRAVGVLVAVARVADALDDLDAGPVGVELVGGDHRQRRADAGPHLGAVRDDVHRAVGIDAQVDARIEGGVVGRRCGSRSTPVLREQRLRHEAGGDDERAGREHAAEEAPAADVGGDDGAAMGAGGRLMPVPRRALDGRADALIRAAPADVAGHRLVDLGVGRARLLGEERRRLHDLAGLAVAALRDVGRDPRALHRMALAGAEALDRDDLASGERAHRRLARADGLAVHVHGAGAAEAAAAAVLRAGQAQLVAQVPEQGHVGVAVERPARPVDREGGHGVRPLLRYAKPRP